MTETAPLSVSDLQAFLDGEIFQNAAGVYQTCSLEEDERVETHTCLKDCVIESVEFNSWGKARLGLRYGVNRSGFREGDSVLLNRPGLRGEGLHTEGFEMDWEEHDPHRRVVTLNQSFSNGRELPFRRGEGVTVDQSLAGHLNMVRQAMDQLAADVGSRPFFDGFLQGSLGNTPVPVDQELFESICGSFGLTASQREAFGLVVGNWPVAGIQGPPGTGKTFVLGAIAAYYLAKKRNVLVSALSHFAINNALNSSAGFIRRLKLPSEAIKVSRIKNDGLELEEGMPLRTATGMKGWAGAGANVYGLTSFKAAHDLRGQKLDVLILDEASQLPLPHAFMMMRHARKTILIGDHRQMRPIISYRHHRHPALYQSVFEFFRSTWPERVRMLTDTFRMNMEITDFPSRLFYDGRLEPHGETAGRRLALAGSGGGTDLWNILDPGNPSVFVELNHRYSNRNSPEEAELVCRLILSAVMDHGVPARSIAVLVPFRAQQELIGTRLRQLAREHHRRFELVLVDTVERMQGQERDLVIYSLTASDPDRLGAMAEFFFDPHRFNVAITRARVKRIVIGSRRLLSARTTDPAVARNISLLCRFMNEGTVVRL